MRACPRSLVPAAPESVRQTRKLSAALRRAVIASEQRERDQLPGSRQRQHEPQARRARRAGSRRCRRASPARAGRRAPATSAGAANRPSAHSGRSSPEPIVSPAPSSTNALIERPGPQVEQVEDVRRQHQHPRRQQPAPVGEAQVAHRQQRQPSEPAAFSAPVESSPRSSAAPWPRQPRGAGADPRESEVSLLARARRRSAPARAPRAHRARPAAISG